MVVKNNEVWSSDANKGLFRVFSGHRRLDDTERYAQPNGMYV